MTDKPLNCTVHVTVTLTLEHPSSWSEKTTIASVHQSAKSEVLSLLRSELGKTKLNCSIKGDPRFVILVKEPNDA